MESCPPIGTATETEPVFERTAAGQREAVDDRLGLSAVDRRILLLVNGFTPFSELAARMPDVPNARSRAHDLMQDGLITQVAMDLDSSAHSWAEIRIGE